MAQNYFQKKNNAYKYKTLKNALNVFQGIGGAFAFPGVGAVIKLWPVAKLKKIR